jgi:hypothetical protein
MIPLDFLSHRHPAATNCPLLNTIHLALGDTLNLICILILADLFSHNFQLLKYLN